MQAGNARVASVLEILPWSIQRAAWTTAPGVRMFSINQRVKHLASQMIGTVIAQRAVMAESRFEIRVLYDEHDNISSWAPEGDYVEAIE